MPIPHRVLAGLLPAGALLGVVLGGPPTPSRAVASPVAAVAPTTVRHLSYGSRGDDVRRLQRALNTFGYALPVTGWFGPMTRAAVLDFQAEHGVPTTGTVGPLTRRALAGAQARPTRKPRATAAGAATGGTRGRKVVYLTFDDGPSARYTPQVLDLLDRYHARATFFEIGQNVAAHPATSRAVVRRGHSLANHTWDHADLTRLSDAGIRREIDRAQAALTAATGRDVTCLRAPYGATNSRVRAVAAGRGLEVKAWDVDPRDWARPGASVVARRVMAAVRPGDVVLMHDGGGDRRQTVSALRTVLGSLAARGYRFERLPGCR